MLKKLLANNTAVKAKQFGHSLILILIFYNRIKRSYKTERLPHADHLLFLSNLRTVNYPQTSRFTQGH